MDRDDANDGSTNRKGKEKEISPPIQPIPNGDSASAGSPLDSNSVMSRLTSSATRLAGDFMRSHATAVAMAEVQPSVKAGPSAATPSTNHRTAADASILPLNPTATAPGRSFRSSQATEKDSSNESSFLAFLDNEKALGITEGNPSGSSQQLEFSGPPLQLRGPVNGQAGGVAEDGLEVVKFLDSGYDELVGGDLEISLPVGEQATLRRALFLDNGQWKRKPTGDYREDILNFFPDFILNSTNKSVDTANHLGISDPEDARAIWVRHWQVVLSSYTDEVWGDLSPLVGEAREELQALSESPEQASFSESGALRRLQQILAHVRGF